MIRTARQKFDRILDALQAHAEAGATVYQAERNLFAQLLALGRLLMNVFFALSAAHRLWRMIRRIFELVLKKLPNGSYCSRRLSLSRSTARPC